MKKCPTCSLYNQTHYLQEVAQKCTKINEICQMYVLHFAELGKLKCIHHTIDSYSGFQWASVLNSEKADSLIAYLWQVMATMGKPVLKEGSLDSQISSWKVKKGDLGMIG